MCGIIGYIGEGEIKQKLISSLSKLEYRGYDSSGMSVVSKGKITTEKALGAICNLEKQVNEKIINAGCGIAHTRWATHGGVTVNNAHPHVSADGTWAVVHNGIIENYLELKRNQEVKFCSETDTEIVPVLLSKNTEKTNINKLISTANSLAGSFALVCLNKAENSTLYLAKRNSPLYVAKNKNSVLICSDPICFGDEFVEYYVLGDNEFCEANLQNLTFFNKKAQKINKKAQKIGVFEQSSSKQGFKYFAEKEINEIPNVFKRIKEVYSSSKLFKKIDKDFISNINRIKIIGCGTAYHAAALGARYIESKTKIETTAHIASEFRSDNPIINKNTLCIFVSQSGETADTLFALKAAKQKRAKIVSVVNVPYSSVARLSHVVIPVCAHAEIAVMSTKAYNAMLAVFYLLALHMQGVIKNKPSNFATKLLPVCKESIVPSTQSISKIAEIVQKFEKVFFIGRGEDFVTAQEASLKLKEITYINSLAIQSGELKHGTLALIDKKTVVFIISTKKQTNQKNLSAASEIKARGGKIVYVSQFLPSESEKDIVDSFIKLPDVSEELSALVSIIPFQLLAYNVCVNLGYNPDKPRNLAKSVTVE